MCKFYVYLNPKAYLAAFLDETGELNLLEPCISDDSALRVGPPH
jgi:hypothetical protein